MDPVRCRHPNCRPGLHTRYHHDVQTAPEWFGLPHVDQFDFTPPCYEQEEPHGTHCPQCHAPHVAHPTTGQQQYQAEQYMYTQFMQYNDYQRQGARHRPPHGHHYQRQYQQEYHQQPQYGPYFQLDVDHCQHCCDMEYNDYQLRYGGYPEPCDHHLHHTAHGHQQNMPHHYPEKELVHSPPITPQYNLSPEPNDPGCTLSVGGLSRNTTIDALREFFLRFRLYVTDMYMKSKRFEEGKVGVVRFSSRFAAGKAVVDLDSSKVDGRQVSVRMNDPDITTYPWNLHAHADQIKNRSTERTTQIPTTPLIHRPFALPNF